jgi:hypothetical protein
MTQGSGSQHRHSSNEAPADVADALAFRSPASGVGAGVRVVPQPCEHDGAQGPVQLPIARAVQPMPGDLPGRGRDGVDPRQGKRGLRAEPAGVRPGGPARPSALRPRRPGTGYAGQPNAAPYQSSGASATVLPGPAARRTAESAAWKVEWSAVRPPRGRRRRRQVVGMMTGLAARGAPERSTPAQSQGRDDHQRDSTWKRATRSLAPC